MSSRLHELFDGRIDVGDTVYYPTTTRPNDPSAQVRVAEIVSLPSKGANWLVLRRLGEAGKAPRMVAGLNSWGVFTETEVAELVAIEPRVGGHSGTPGWLEMLTSGESRCQIAQRLAREVVTRVAQEDAYMSGEFEEMMLAGEPMVATT